VTARAGPAENAALPMSANPSSLESVRVLIVDDEPPARERLRSLLGELDDVVVAGEAANGREALEMCVRLEPDVVLLDIRMPGMDGIEAARHISALDDPPAVVFTTAHDEYALEAFEAQAIGYLLKPVRLEKLARAIRRAARVAGPQLLRIAEASQLGRRRSQVCARLGSELRLIPLEDVFYFSAGQKYVTVRHRGGSDLIDESLRALAAEFAPEFVRIHRNSLVAVRPVCAAERSADGHYLVRFSDCAETLPVSRRHAAQTLRQLRGEH
jgi:two-component system, LytTR family, response regulator AlgR